MRTFIAAVGALGISALAVVATEQPVSAWPAPCDFLTGGGFIIHNGAKANFGVGGGCKHGSPTWGHLEYHDHGTGLNLHWTAITAYLAEGDGVGDTTTDPKTGQPLGTRLICGTARTNQFGDVDFFVRAKDAGEPGVNDEFDLRASKLGLIVYTTETEPGAPHTLGGGTGGGGNIQLHKPNPSTSGNLGGECPARDAI